MYALNFSIESVKWLFPEKTFFGAQEEGRFLEQPQIGHV